jgi:hypothetical protein
MDFPPIRNDIWICGWCKQPNTIALANEQCPYCTHVRDYGIGCCANPGEYPQSSALFTGHFHRQDTNCSLSVIGCHVRGGVTDGPDDMWHCNECGADNPDWHKEQCPVCGASKNASMQYAALLAIAASSGAGSAAEGSWTCSNCRCANAGFHWPVCGACHYNHSQ